MVFHAIRNRIFALDYTVIAGIFWTALLACYIFIPLPTYQHWHDLWEHVAAVRELAQSPFHPQHPQLAVDAPSRQFTPANLLLAFLVRAFSISPTDAVVASGPVYLLIVIVGLKKFLSGYFCDTRAPSLGLIILLGLWGTPWVSTGLHNARSLFYSAAYPATLVFGIGVFMWARALKFSRTEFSTRDFAFFSFFTFFSFVSHQLSSVISLIFLFLLLGFNSGFSKKSFFLTVLAAISGIAASTLWPYFNPVALVLSGGNDPINRGNSQFEQIIPVLLLTGPSLAGLLGLKHCLNERRLTAIPAALCIFLALYLAGAVLKNPVTHRFLAPAVLSLHLMFLAWIISPRTACIDRFKIPLPKALTVCLLLLGGQASSIVFDISKITINRFDQRQPWRYGLMPVVADMTLISRSLSRNSVVAADPTLSVSLPAFGGKLVASYRGINMIQDLQQRRNDNSLLLGDDTPLETRKAIAKKYGVTHLLVVERDISSSGANDLLAIGKPLASPPGILFLEMDAGTK